MKKILTFIISMFIITACQQDEEESINRSNESTTTLSISKELRILSNFNDSILQFQPQTKGFGGTLLATVSADVMAMKAGFEISSRVAAFITVLSGGTAGPITGIAVLTSSGLIGAGASYGAYKGCTLSCSPNDEFYDELLNNIMANQLGISNSVSICRKKIETSNLIKTDITNTVLDRNLCIITADLHNSIINSTIEYEKHPITRTNIDVSIPVEPFEESSYKIPLFTDSEIIDMVTTCNNTMKNYYKTHNYKNTLSEMIAQNLISNESGNILVLFLDVLQSYNGDETNLDTIINTYSKIVSESNNIRATDKNGLLIAFVTAKNSICLWKEKI